MPDLSANRFWRRATIALAVALALWLMYFGIRHEWAYHYSVSSDPNDWLRAANIETQNAEYWYQLGRYRQLDFDHADLPLAISYYRQAVKLDPRSPFYKLDLASALEMAGNNAEADQYFRAAQDGYPNSSEVSWRYGNFLLRESRLPEAYAEFHRAVLVDPKLMPLAISRAWRSNPDVRVIVDQVLPHTAAADAEALAFFVQSENIEPALVVWNRIMAQPSSMDERTSFPLIDLLLKQNRFDDATSVWKKTLGKTGITGAPTVDSLVTDGGFENELLNGGFGWRLQEIAGADFDFDSAEKHSGMRSAHIIFDGSQNSDYGNLYQFLVVQPGSHYHFRGYIRTDQISTSSGMRFEIRDVRHNENLDVLTPSETGSTPWTLEELDFTPGPQTYLVQIVVRRLPSVHFDNKLRGTVWIDDLSVVRQRTEE